MFEILSVISSFIIKIISTTGYFGITGLMTLESACIPIPSEIIMPFSGYLVFEGEFNFLWVVIFGALGNLIGSIIAYLVGIYAGRPFIQRWGRYILISDHDLERTEQWFKKYGQSTVLFSRVLPVIRTFISLPAGLARMDFKKFCFYTLVGSLPWSFVLTYVGMIMGENWSAIEVYFHKFDFIIGGLIILGIIWWIWKHIKSSKLKTQSSKLMSF